LISVDDCDPILSVLQRWRLLHVGEPASLVIGQLKPVRAHWRLGLRHLALLSFDQLVDGDALTRVRLVELAHLRHHHGAVLWIGGEPSMGQVCALRIVFLLGLQHSEPPLTGLAHACGLELSRRNPVAVVAPSRHGRPMPEMHGAAHWRSKAEEARAIAAGMQDPAAKTTMLSIADSYDRMAHYTDAIAEAERVLGRAAKPE